MLNTMSSAHNKIFGAKFSSFEHLEAMRLYTVSYAVFRRGAMKSDSQMSHFCMQIAPLLHSNSATIIMQ